MTSIIQCDRSIWAGKGPPTIQPCKLTPFTSIRELLKRHCRALGVVQRNRRTGNFDLLEVASQPRQIGNGNFLRGNPPKCEGAHHVLQVGLGRLTVGHFDAMIA